MGAASAAGVWLAFFAAFCGLLVVVEPMWSLWDAAYFAVMSLTTVGMGDVVVASALGRLITGAAILIHSVFLASLLTLVVARGGRLMRVSLSSALASMLVVTVAGLVAVEDMTLGDAAWLTVTTLTTAGFGDIAPRTGSGRALLAIMALCGPVALSLVGARLAQSWIARFEDSGPTPAPTRAADAGSAPRKRAARAHINVEYTR